MELPSLEVAEEAQAGADPVVHIHTWKQQFWDGASQTAGMRLLSRRKTFLVNILMPRTSLLLGITTSPAASSSSTGVRLHKILPESQNVWRDLSQAELGASPHLLLQET